MEPSTSRVYYWGMLKPMSSPVPEEVPALRNQQVVKVSSGGFYYLALTADGRVFGWGTTKHSRFGYSEPEFIQVPKQLPLNIPITRIAAGNWHSVMVGADGLGYGIGYNKNGSCGVGSFETPLDKLVPMVLKQPLSDVFAGDDFSLMLSREGDLYSSGHTEFHGHTSKDHINVPKKFAFPEKIITAAAGFTHALAVSVTGLVYSWGNGTFFQLGHGDNKAKKTPAVVQRLKNVKIIQVSCTRGQKNAHSMATGEDGEVYTWGSGYKGKLGHAEEWNHGDPADEPYPKRIKFLDEVKIRKCSAGGIHSTVLAEDGNILTFGCGSDGRLGHIESTSHKYLYREGAPRPLEMKGVQFTDLATSYYHNIALGISN